MTNLDSLDELKICVGYKYKGKLYEEMPCELSVLEKGTPQYITMPGWKQSTIGIKNYDDLPKKARILRRKALQVVWSKTDDHLYRPAQGRKP